MKIYDLPVESKDLTKKEIQAITGGFGPMSIIKEQLKFDLNAFVASRTGSIAAGAVAGAKEAAKEAAKKSARRSSRRSRYSRRFAR